MKKEFKFSIDASYRLLLNGNFYPQLSHPHVWHLRQYQEIFLEALCEEVSVIYCRESDFIEYDGLLNTSQEVVTIKSGYNTRASGWCDDLFLRPGEIMIRTTKGNASAFSAYRIFKSEDSAR